MRELKYTSHDGTVIDLNADDLWVADLQEMRGYAWTYTLATRGIKSVSRNASTAKMTVRTKTPAVLDAAQTAFDADVQAVKPGMLTVDGEWSQHAYIVGSSLGLVPWPDYAQVDYTAVLCDGVWRRALPVQHFFPMAAGTSSQLDLPTDLPTDLASSRIALTVDNPTGKTAEFSAIIFGPCTNPSFRLGGNTYEVDVTVPFGGYVSLSATGLSKTITLTAENGDVTNIFDKGVRGDGAGSGSYVFEPIPAGESLLEISGNYGIDLTLHDVSGGVPWRTLSSQTAS